MRRTPKNSRHQSIQTIWYCLSPIAHSSKNRTKIAKKEIHSDSKWSPILLFVKQNRLEYSLPPFPNTNFANITSLWIWSFDGPADWIISNQIRTFHLSNWHFSPKYAFISSKQMTRFKWQMKFCRSPIKSKFSYNLVTLVSCDILTANKCDACDCMTVHKCPKCVSHWLGFTSKIHVFRFFLVWFVVQKTIVILRHNFGFFSPVKYKIWCEIRRDSKKIDINVVKSIHHYMIRFMESL